MFLIFSLFSFNLFSEVSENTEAMENEQKSEEQKNKGVSVLPKQEEPIVVETVDTATPVSNKKSKKKKKKNIKQSEEISAPLSLEYYAKTLKEDPAAYYNEKVLHKETVNYKEIKNSLFNLLNIAFTDKKSVQQGISSAESLYAINALSEAELHKKYFNQAKYLAENSSPGSALAMINNYFNLKHIDDTGLIYLFNLAIDNLSISNLQIIKMEMDKRGLDSSKSEAILNKTYAQSELMKGTVMVNVDKGFVKKGPISMPISEIGSGFFIDKQGYLITNYHVIKSLVDPTYTGVAKLSVMLYNSLGEKLPAKVIGYSEVNDLALLKVDYEPEYVFSFHQNKTKIEIGETVFALGSPAGLSFTLTSGLVSNASRQLLPIGDVIQIDAAVNPGNSGGPLVNKDGEILGVVFAGIPQFQGLNFALPGDITQTLLPKLAFKGSIDLPFLGISIYSWQNNHQEISFVPQNHPLSFGGIQTGEYLYKINNLVFESFIDMQKYLIKLQPNTFITLTTGKLGGDELKTAIFTLGRRSEKLGESLLKFNSIDKFYKPLYGMEVNRVSSKQFIVKKVLPGMQGMQQGFNKNDTFEFIRREDTPLKDELLAIRVFSTSRQLGVYEGRSGLLLYSPVDNGSWL